MRYYFDLRDGDEIITDDEGLELNGIDRVQEAACSLADMAKDAARSHRTDGTKYAPAFAALNPVRCTSTSRPRASSPML
jgi:hypothetical protein